MTKEKEQIVGRLHGVLLNEIRARRPQYLREPFTVAEIYQDLVPYRSHRDQVGVAMNGDYEHALLRLLSGEGGFLVLESEPARRRLVEELESSNPNTGVFREFAALDVRLNPAFVPAAAQTEAPPESAPVETKRGDARPTVERKGRVGAARAVPDAVSASARGACHWCAGELPDRSTLRFCPHCGKNVNLVPCRTCGEELDSGWRFCLACGAEQAAAG